MTRLTKFSESFWGADFTSTAGFDALIRRMQDGKKFCREYEDFLKQRYSMESKYSQDLNRLAKSMRPHDDLGVLEKSWNQLRAEVEGMAAIHGEAATAFQQQYEELKKFTDAQNSKKKMVEDQVKKYQQNKIQLHGRCMNNQKNYVQKCREKDLAKEQYSTFRNSVTVTAKELEKARIKSERTEEEMIKSENLYKSSVHTLESSRNQWEKEMSAACEVFQQLDEERISVLREEIWNSTNVDSKVAVDVDQASERIRQVLEHCDIQEDVCQFIDRRKTGTERPAPIEYENYYSNTDFHVSADSGNGRRPPQGTATVGGAHQRGNNRPQVNRPQVNRPQPNRQTVLPVEGDPLYATVQDI